MERNTRKNTGKSYTIEVLMFLTYAFFAVNWIVGTNMSPQILEAFGARADSTAIQNAVTLAKIIGNLLAASILNKLYPKKSIGLGALLITLGCYIAAFAPTYSIFVIGRFVMGFGGALYVVYFAPIVLEYFTADKRPTINAFNNVAYNIGGIFALLFITPVVNWLSNPRYVLIFFATISLVLFILWVFVGEDFPLADDPTEDKYSLKDGASTKIAWVMPLMYFGHLLLYMVMLNLFPNTSLSVIPANRVSLLFTIGGILGTAISVVVAMRSKKRVPVIKICGILIPILAFILVSVQSAAVTTITALALGAIMYIPLTNLVTIPQELPGMTKGLLTQIMSVFWSLAYILETIGFFVIGKIQYAYGDRPAIYLAIVLSFSFFIGSFFMPEPSETKTNYSHHK